MFSKAKLVAAFAALAIGVTAFASASQATTYYYWGWGWQPVPAAYVPYGVNTRDHYRVCYWAPQYTQWGVYVGNTYVCTPI